MPIPAQTVQVVPSRTEPEFADVTLESLHLPAKNALKAPSEEALPKLLDKWFQSLPCCEDQSGCLNEIILRDRSYPGQVRKITARLHDGRIAEAELIYFNSSPEVWVARLVQDLPDASKYAIYSWHGNRIPNIKFISSQGEIRDASLSGNPREDLLSTILTCEFALRALRIANKITGTPQYKDEAILHFLEVNRSELDRDVGSAIVNLPRRIYEAHFKTDDRVYLGSIDPFSRQDLEFYHDGSLNISAVREAYPALMQWHDILKLHGFSPVLEVETRVGSRISMFTLYLETKEALMLVKMAERQF